MARNRMVKPEYWADQKLAEASRDARLLYIALWNFSDDFGVVKGHHRWLQGQIFPYDNVSPSSFDGWLGELVALERIRKFQHNGEEFYFIFNFSKHQTINRPSTQNRNPAPPDSWPAEQEQDGNTHGVITEVSVSNQAKEKLSEVEKKLITDCSEPEADSEPDEDPPVMEVPLVKKDGSFIVRQSYIDELRESYDGLNVLAALKAARQWLRDNPNKLKTRKGIRKFISAWCERDKNAGRNLLATGVQARAAPAGPRWPKQVECRFCLPGQDVFGIDRGQTFLLKGYEGSCPNCGERYYEKKTDGWHEREPPSASAERIAELTSSLGKKFSAGAEAGESRLA